uniref:Expressed conserved protein n=1 Tax=Echinococcus granulosus TaxID=6210 RepID=A0A068X2Y1_ECHGR|nr:hypothetical protein EgrG_002065300 [Echinococcus granulosus]
MEIIVLKLVSLKPALNLNRNSAYCIVYGDLDFNTEPPNQQAVLIQLQLRRALLERLCVLSPNPFAQRPIPQPLRYAHLMCLYSDEFICKNMRSGCLSISQSPLVCSSVLVVNSSALMSAVSNIEMVPFAGDEVQAQDDEPYGHDFAPSFRGCHFFKDIPEAEAKSPTRRKTLSRITKEQWLFASATKERYLRGKFAAAAAAADDDDGVGCFAYPSTGADFGLLS